VFNVICQRLTAIYNGGCQICCNRSRLKTGFHLPAHRSTKICCNRSRLKPGFHLPAHPNTMPQINMISHPVMSL